jgi:hypothetical protein
MPAFRSLSTTANTSSVEAGLSWRTMSAVSGFARRADEARAAGRRADADALLLSAWAALDA